MHVEWVDLEAVILDPRTERLHYLNPTAALLFGLIQEFGYDDAIEQMHNRFGSVEDLDQTLADAVGLMLEEGLLEDD